MSNRKLGEMTAAERKQAIDRALDQLQAELRASADKIGAIMDTAEAEPEPVPDSIYRAELAGHQAAMADAQACKTAANGTTLWRSREHRVPADADERAAWMRGYGKQFAYWGGERFDD